MFSTAMTQGLAAEHRRDLLRSADGWRSVRTVVLARRNERRQRRLLADLAAATRATPGFDSASSVRPGDARTVSWTAERR